MRSYPSKQAVHVLLALIDLQLDKALTQFPKYSTYPWQQERQRLVFVTFWQSGLVAMQALLRELQQQPEQHSLQKVRERSRVLQLGSVQLLVGGLSVEVVGLEVVTDVQKGRNTTFDEPLPVVVVAGLVVVVVVQALLLGVFEVVVVVSPGSVVAAEFEEAEEVDEGVDVVVCVEVGVVVLVVVVVVDDVQTPLTNTQLAVQLVQTLLTTVAQGLLTTRVLVPELSPWMQAIKAASKVGLAMISLMLALMLVVLAVL